MISYSSTLKTEASKYIGRCPLLHRNHETRTVRPYSTPRGPLFRDVSSEDMGSQLQLGMGHHTFMAAFMVFKSASKSKDRA